MVVILSHSVTHHQITHHQITTKSPTTKCSVFSHFCVFVFLLLVHLGNQCHLSCAHKPCLILWWTSGRPLISLSSLWWHQCIFLWVWRGRGAGWRSEATTGLVTQSCWTFRPQEMVDNHPLLCSRSKARFYWFFTSACLDN